MEKSYIQNFRVVSRVSWVKEWRDENEDERENERENDSSVLTLQRFTGHESRYLRGVSQAKSAKSIHRCSHITLWEFGRLHQASPRRQPLMPAAVSGFLQ